MSDPKHSNCHRNTYVHAYVHVPCTGKTTAANLGSPFSVLDFSPYRRTSIAAALEFADFGELQSKVQAELMLICIGHELVQATVTQNRCIVLASRWPNQTSASPHVMNQRRQQE